MEKLFSIYESLYRDRVFLVCKPLCSGTGAIVECCGATAVYIDVARIETAAEECVVVAHEAGHYYTGTTYGVHSSPALVARHEALADRWAIQKLIPRDELNDALQKGYTEAWQLADYFDVTEEFIKKAGAYYLGASPPDEPFTA